MKNEIPVAGVRPPGRHLPVRRATRRRSVLEHRLPRARGRQPLRRRHELLPEHRRRQPGADGDGQRAAGRRPPARADALKPVANRSHRRASRSRSCRGDQRAVVVEVGGGLRTYRPAADELLDGYGPDEACTSGRGQVLAPGRTGSRTAATSSTGAATSSRSTSRSTETPSTGSCAGLPGPCRRGRGTAS